MCERELEDELILYNPESDQIVLLNRVAAMIWSFSDGRRTSREIAEEIAMIFTAPHEAVLRDVESTLADLARKGVLQETSV